MAKIKREELSGQFLKAFDKIVDLKNSDDAKQREAGLKGEKTLIKILESKKGQAVKKVVTPKAKATPKKAKATPKKAKATSKKAKATPKKVSVTETNPKGLPFATRVKQRADKDGITFREARVKLSKEIQDEKDKIEATIKEDKKKALKELEKLTKAPEFQQALSQFPKKSGGKKRALKSNVSADGKRQALPRGKRISQGKGANQYGKAKKGKVYYEYRDNRSDVNSVPTKAGQYKYKGKTPPYLEAGGTLPTPFGQAGLVGETGTLNEVDLFAMGGGLPQGVHQYYANTYNPAYPTPHGYAKGGDVTYTDTKNPISTTSFKIWENYKNINNQQSVGSFSHNYNKRNVGDYYLFLLDDYDRNFYSHIPLKPNEMLFRSETETGRISKSLPLIKINLQNGRVYFMSDDNDINSDYDDKNPKFQKASADVNYLSLDDRIKKYNQGLITLDELSESVNKTYAKGGALNSLKNQMNDDLEIHSEYYAEGGMIEIDEDGGNIPSELMEVFSDFNEDEDSYKEMERLRLKAQEIGYDFDYDLSGQPTEFMKIDTYAKGGDLERFRKTKQHDIYFDFTEFDKIDSAGRTQRRYEHPPLSYETTMKMLDEFKKQPKKYIVVESKKNDDGFIIYKKLKEDRRKKVMQFRASQSGLYAKGGRTISIVNDGVKYDKSKYKAVYGDYDKDGVVNIDDANPLNKNKKGKVEEIELKNTFDKLLGVKAELDTIMYDAVDTLDEKAPKGADIYARTKTPYSILKKLVEKRMLDPKKGLTDMIGTTIAVDNQKELVELRDKIDNGLLGKVLDRDDFYKRPNAGYRAYHYIVEYKGVPVEVQLKTKNMKKLHEVSHKAYKNGNLDAKSLDFVSKTFMKADKGDSKAKAEIDRLLKDKKQLISKITKD